MEKPSKHRKEPTTTRPTRVFKQYGVQRGCTPFGLVQGGGGAIFLFGKALSYHSCHQLDPWVQPGQYFASSSRTMPSVDPSCDYEIGQQSQPKLVTI